MNSAPFEQRNPYKGNPPRAWVRLRLRALAGATQELDLLADTGSPTAIVLSRAMMALMKRRQAPNVNSNFGILEGGRFYVTQPELGVDQDVLGYASDTFAAAAKRSCSDFEGVAGLPLLRLFEYGGDANSFWLRPISPPPAAPP
jgi:hypothetical protein